MKIEGDEAVEFLSIGDNCVDWYTDTNKKFAGGNALNVAVYMKELGADATYMGVVGNDNNGSFIIDALQQKGMDTSMISVKQGKTAVTEVQLKDGNRVFGYFDEGVFTDFSLEAEDLLALKYYPYIHTAVGGKCESNLQYLHDTATISYDFSATQDIDYIYAVCRHIDYAFISYSKEDSFINKVLQGMCNSGAKVAVATLGENGSIAFDGQRFFRHDIEKVDVVDTLGAGDSFIAGFMHEVSRGGATSDCLRKGAQMAGKTIQYFGAW